MNLPHLQKKNQLTDVEEGSGEVAGTGSTKTMSYTGTLKEGGTKFDSASKFTFTIGGGDGVDIRVNGIKVGGKRMLTVAAKLGYGKGGSLPEIPGDAVLCFEVK